DIPTNKITTLRNTRFYLDTPFLFMLSGSRGEESEQIATDIVNYIRNKQGKLWIFDSTFSEIDTIMEGSKNVYASSDFNYTLANPLARYFRDYRDSKFSSRVKVETWIKKFKDKLFTTHQIEIDRVEYDSETSFNSYSIDVEKLEAVFRNRENSEGSNFDAIQTDIKNISAIYKIRKDDGKKYYSSWEQTPAVFLTTSYQLVLGASEVRQSDKNHKIPSILLIGKMIYIIAEANYKKFKQEIKIQLLSFANTILEKKGSEIKNRFLEEYEKNPTEHYSKEELEIMVEQTINPLIVTNSLENNKNIVINADVIKESRKTIAENLQAKEKYQQLEQEKNSIKAKKDDAEKTISEKERELEKMRNIAEKAKTKEELAIKKSETIETISKLKDKKNKPEDHMSDSQREKWNHINKLKTGSVIIGIFVSVIFLILYFFIQDVFTKHNILIYSISGTIILFALQRFFIQWTEKNNLKVNIIEQFENEIKRLEREKDSLEKEFLSLE
ncbi:MAG: hypothetical protein ACRCTJ_02450, partial [Brevinema sp.]